MVKRPWLPEPRHAQPLPAARRRSLSSPAGPAGPGLHPSAQPRGDGFDAHRAGGSSVGLRQARCLLPRACPGRRRADRHRRFRALPRRLAAALRQQPHQRPGGARPSSPDPGGACRGRQDPAADPPRRALWLPPDGGVRLAVEVADQLVHPARALRARHPQDHPRLRPLRAAGQGRRLRRRGGDGQRRLPAQPVPLPAHQSPRRPVGRPAGKPHAPGAGDRPRHPADRRPTLHPLLSPVAARPGRGRQYLGRGAAHRPGPGGSRNHPAQHRHRLARVARADHRHLGAARGLRRGQRTAAPRAEGAGDRQ